MTGREFPVRRRVLLAGTLASALGAAGCRAGPPAPADAAHQPGVVTAPPAAALVRALDVDGRGDRPAAVLRGLTAGADRARRSGATVTLAVGASLFDHRFGLARRKPEHLTAMPSFPNDDLDPARCHGDLLIQVCAKDPRTARGVMDGLAHPALRTRWEIAGFRPDNGASADGKPSTRDLFGFREGEGNPDPADPALMNELVWVQPGTGEPAWAAGGTYQVVRIIRFSLPLWNAESAGGQERVFGRRKRDGAPLGRAAETASFDYRHDPDGRVIALDAHIRRANPRTPETERNRILRRGYSYRRGPDASGLRDEGLAFICFQRDLERGFATVQHRLDGEALSRYVLPVGGGYFFVLPGGGPYLGHGLFAD